MTAIDEAEYAMWRARLAYYGTNAGAPAPEEAPKEMSHDRD